MRNPTDNAPLFWTEPWRWAEPTWRSRYGVPERDLDMRAARLVYSGWAARYSLPLRWSPPADSRWLQVVQVSPDVCRILASVLGFIALLRGGAAVALTCRSPADPWLAFALKFRDVNCMRPGRSWGKLDLSAEHAHTCGVEVLKAMARCDWPIIGSRLAMLVAPTVCHDASHCGTLVQTMNGGAAPIESIDVKRCLSLCGAVTRQVDAREIL